MNEQVMINALNSMTQENASLILNNHLLRAELELVKKELAELKQPKEESIEEMMK